MGGRGRVVSAVNDRAGPRRWHTHIDWRERAAVIEGQPIESIHEEGVARVLPRRSSSAEEDRFRMAMRAFLLRSRASCSSLPTIASRPSPRILSRTFCS